MKTDMLILQVVDKVRKDHNLQFRGLNNHNKSKKNFGTLHSLCHHQCSQSDDAKFEEERATC